MNSNFETHERKWKLRFQYLLSLFLRISARFLTKYLYNVKVTGIENVPQKGAALVIANHTSFVDFLVLTHITSENFRIMYGVLDYSIYSKRFIKQISSATGTIPVATRAENIDVRERAFELIKWRLSRGDLVLIFLRVS